MSRSLIGAAHDGTTYWREELFDGRVVQYTVLTETHEPNEEIKIISLDGKLMIASLEEEHIEHVIRNNIIMDYCDQEVFKDKLNGKVPLMPSEEELSNLFFDQQLELFEK